MTNSDHRVWTQTPRRTVGSVLIPSWGMVPQSEKKLIGRWTISRDTVGDVIESPPKRVRHAGVPVVQLPAERKYAQENISLERMERGRIDRQRPLSTLP